jgi:histone H3/H4
MGNISNETIQEIAKKAGAKSISEDAADKVAEHVSNLGQEILEKAESRTDDETIKSKDIQESIRG